MNHSLFLVFSSYNVMLDIANDGAEATIEVSADGYYTKSYQKLIRPDLESRSFEISIFNIDYYDYDDLHHHLESFQL